MSYILHLQCIHCATIYDASRDIYYCPQCGYQEGILDVKYDYQAVRNVLNRETLQSNTVRSMWRYLPLLPVEQPRYIQHLQVGWTPLYETSRLAQALGVSRCWVKDEGRNPTASFKDRASAIGVIKALEQGASRVTCASTGNAASSLAGFAAAAGLPATIFVPARAPEAKIAQLLVYGAEVFAVEGTYDQAWELCMQAAAEFGWYNRNCAINPYLIEGKKTVTLELAEQFRLILGEQMPDWVAVSVGDGCTAGGVGKGLQEMHELGIVDKVPRVLGVQAEGCQPFVTAWNGDGKLVPGAADTLADSIAVGHPRNFQKGMNAITRTGGAFIAVSDTEILTAMKTLARTAAVFGEPAGTAAVAGVGKAVETGMIQPNETVAILVTGNGLKDIKSAIQAAGQPSRIKPDIQAMKNFLAKGVSP